MLLNNQFLINKTEEQKGQNDILLSSVVNSNLIVKYINVFMKAIRNSWELSE
jgi:hypothetical protein